MGGKRQQQSPNRYNRSSTGGFDPRGPGVPSSGSPARFGGTPNRWGLNDYNGAAQQQAAAMQSQGYGGHQALRPYQGGMNRPTPTPPTPYNLDPRQAAQFAALPAATQERYYQGGMNRPTGMAPPIQGGMNPYGTRRIPYGPAQSGGASGPSSNNTPTGMAAPPSLPPTMRNKVPRNRIPPGVMSPAPVGMAPPRNQQLAAQLQRGY